MSRPASATTAAQIRRRLRALQKRAERLPGAREATREAPVELAHPTQVDAAPVGPAWLGEVKRDGFRGVVIVRGGRVQFRTRKGHDWTSRVPSIASAVEGLGLQDAQLDGELIAVGDDGREDFSLLQSSIGGARRPARPSSTPLAYVAFDLVRLEGLSLVDVALIDRRSLLDELVRDSGISANGYHLGQGPELFEAIREAGHEGLIAKRMDSPYPKGRTRSWLKIMARMRTELVIVGWMKGEGKSSGGLMLAQFRNGTLRYVGRVGAGLGNLAMRELSAALTARREPSLDVTPYLAARKHRIRWYEPNRLARIDYRSWTATGELRHASYKGLAPNS